MLWLLAPCALSHAQLAPTAAVDAGVAPQPDGDASVLQPPDAGAVDLSVGEIPESEVTTPAAYKTTDYVTEVSRIFGPKTTGFMTGGERGGGVDVSLNGVSGPTLETDPQVIRKRGRWVIDGWAGGRGVLNTAAFGYDGITIMPFSSIAWMGTPEHRAGQELVKEWLEHEPLLEPHVFAFPKASEALAALSQGHTQGKVVLHIEG
jgi:NADPH:quinone reductase-like Zn-dependent oxidoreductase